MADYHAVLKRAIDALPDNTGSARRAVYQRARTAIVNQLKSYDPPLSPSDITTEQLHLEEAIRKVEADAARQTLGLGPQQPPRPAPDAPARPAAPAVPGAASQAPHSPKPEAPKPEAPTPEAQKPEAAKPEAPKPDSPTSEAPQPHVSQSHVAQPGTQGVPASGDAPAAPVRPQERGKSADGPTEPAKAKGGLFSGLRRASGKGKTSEAKPSEAKIGTDRAEPVLGGAGMVAKPDPAAPMSGPTLSSRSQANAAPSGPRGDSAKAAAGDTVLEKDPAAPAAPRGASTRDSAMRANRDARAKPTRVPAIAAVVAALIIFGGLAAGVYSQRHAILEMIESIGTNVATAPDGNAEAPQSEPADSAPDTGAAPKSEERILGDDGSPAAPDARAVTTTRITPPADAEGGVTSAAPAGNGARVVTPDAPAEAPRVPQASDAPAPAAETPLAALPPIPGATPPAQKDAGLQIAQRSILYEEGEGADASGTASQGQVVWSTLQETAPGTEIIDTVLKANVVIPDRDIGVNVSIRPNRDETLPASHLIEIRFTLPEGFEGKGVANVPGLIMKTTEEARGDALVGASVRVDSGFFWVALSSLDAEKQRNETLLRDRGWIDIPILYDSGKRAILTLEKGTAGERAVQAALDAWTAG